MKLNINHIAIAIAFIFTGCASFDLKILTDKSEPLREFTLSGTASSKVLIIPIDGVISDHDDFSLLTEDPGMVEHVVSQLKLAEEDSRVKAVLLKINSPGGLTTASDVIYNELVQFKKRTNKTIVVSMMDVAASGGYMISLPADLITAHPTTVTGSVGVIFMRPQVSGLMNKLGLGMKITKSGKNKDMGSPFRESTPEEDTLFQNLINQLNNRFVSLVKKHRSITPENLKEIKTARVFLAEDALKNGLVDKICYLDDAIEKCKEIAGIPEDSRIVVYRRIRYPNDNMYNTSISHYGGSKVSLINADILNLMGSSKSGFYAIWPGAVGN